MSRNRKMGLMVPNRSALPKCTRKRAARVPCLRRPTLRLEQLEDRVTPSVNPATPFELDGTATNNTNGNHDWNQIFADAGSPAGSASFTHGTTSLAVAGSFVTDETTGDPNFSGGSTKDSLVVHVRGPDGPSEKPRPDLDTPASVGRQLLLVVGAHGSDFRQPVRRGQNARTHEGRRRVRSAIGRCRKRPV
jgi:hypothetical protein